MNIKAYLDGVETPINTGFTIRQTITEELDTAMVILPWQEGNLQLHQFDDFKITIDDKSFTFVVGDYQTDLANKELDLYNYQVSLISETIKLQKIPLPNLAITQNLSGNIKKIYDYTSRYYNMYIKPRYPELVLDRKLSAETLDIICPEMQWNEPTAYEVYNDLLAPIDSLVKVNDHKIGSIKITDKGNPIDESKIFFTNKAKAINDNINEINVEAQNAYTAGVNIASSRGITCRDIDQAGITTDDLKIHLDKPIEKITEAWLECLCEINGQKKSLQVNLTDRIKEISVYNTLKLSNAPGYEPDKSAKRRNLYYTKGGNDIEGLSFSEKGIFGIGDTPKAIQNIIVCAWNDKYPEQVGLKILDDLRDIRFYIEYITSDNVKFAIKKEAKHYAGIVDHQSESYVDANQFGSAEEMTLKRLGNEVKEINAQYKNIADVPSLGDYIGDYILITRELNIYNDYILFKGTLSKDYVNRDLFYGVNAKKRNTQIVLGNDALMRTDVERYHCCFAFEPKENDPYLAMGQYMAKKFLLGSMTMLEPIYNKLDSLNIKAVTMKSTFEDGTETDMFLTSPSTYKVGNQVVMTFRAYDNYSVGMYIDDPKQKGGYGQDYARYCDWYGEAKTITYALFESVNPYYRAHPEFVSIPSEQIQFNENEIRLARQMPIAKYGENEILSERRKSLESSRIVYKDNREITALSLQFDFKSKNSDNIIITDLVPDYSPLIEYIYSGPGGLNVTISTTEKYKVGDTKGKGLTYVNDLELDYSEYKAWLESDRDPTKLTNKIKLFIKPDSGVTLDGATSWGIVDNNNNLLVGVNKRDTDTTIVDSIYLIVEKDNL